MEAKDTTIGQLFGGLDRYEVPAYQRPYVWTAERQWEPLWDDIERIADRRLGGIDEQHFLGAVVLRREKTPPGGIVEWSVIDGQQRLTTLQVIIASIADAARSDGVAAAAHLLDALLRHGEIFAEGDQRFRFWPTTANQGAYRAVMREGGPSLPWENDPENNIHEAFTFFRAHANAYAHADEASPDEVTARYGALRESVAGLVQLVTITLDANDPAQVIFETLNARGTPLLAMDLVKNAIFAAAHKAGAVVEELNEQVWVPAFGDDQYWNTDVRIGRLTMPRSEVFLFHWLAMKLGEIIPADRLFDVFRRRVLNGDDTDAVALLEEMARDAEIMRSFDHPPAGTQKARFFATLASLDTTTMHPIALLLYRSGISEERVDRALAAIESFHMRRALMGLSAQSYTQLSARLIRRSTDDLARADEIIIEELATAAADNLRWPSDGELRARLLDSPVYGYIGRPRIVLALTALEESKRSAKTGSLALPPILEVEHLMPQAWEKNWPLTAPTEELRQRRDEYVNRIGNLTLITKPLNASLSNAAWASKRKSLNQHDVLLINSHLQDIDLWDESSIDARGSDIADVVIKRWPGAAVFIADASGGLGSELAPEMVITDDVLLARLYTNGSDNLRLLLDALAAASGEELTFLQLDERLDWPAKRAASVIAAFERTSAARDSASGTRPWRMRLTADGVWSLWVDDEQAAALRAAAPQPIALTFVEGEITAMGTLVGKRLTVHSGSRARADLTPSSGDGLRAAREGLLAAGILVVDGESLVFASDYTFTSPHQAIIQIAGGSRSAPQSWKTPEGRQLGEVLNHLETDA